MEAQPKTNLEIIGEVYHFDGTDQGLMGLLDLQQGENNLQKIRYMAENAQSEPLKKIGMTKGEFMSLLQEEYERILM